MAVRWDDEHPSRPQQRPDLDAIECDFAARAKNSSRSPSGSGSRRVSMVRRPSMQVSIRSFLTMMSSVKG